MRPIQGSTCLLPEPMVQNNLPRALRLLFSPEPPPDTWILSRKRGDLAAGFKIMAHQLQALRSEAVFWEYLAQEKIPVVLCFRYNILMQYVSDLIAMATRQSTCWDGKVRTAKVVVPVETLGRELRRIMAEKKYLLQRVEGAGLEKRRVRYEDFKDDVAPAEALFTWLTGEKAPLTTKLSKQNPDALCDRVTNYDRVVAEIRKLGLERLLDNTTGEE